MISALQTNTRNTPGITKMLSMIKIDVTFEQHTKNLTKAKKPDLVETYAYLIGAGAEDSKVSMLKVEGLRLAIMATLMRLRPEFCTESRNDDPFHMNPGGSPQVVGVNCEIRLVLTAIKGKTSPEAG